MKFTSTFMKKKWQDPLWQIHISQAMKRYWSSPVHRRRQAEATRQQWLKPGMRRRLEAAMRRPWRDSKHVARMSRISKARWRDPRYRPLLMANAKRALGPSRGAKRLHSVLGAEWILEYWTSCGPVDLAHPQLKVAVEVDDPGHRRTKQRKRDRQKERGLRRCGWTVIRVSEAKCCALKKGGRAC